MSTQTTVVKTIGRIETLNCSANANPRFRVHCTDGSTFETQADASVNYGIRNPELAHVPVRFTLSRHGRIIYADALSPVTIEGLKRLSALSFRWGTDDGYSPEVLTRSKLAARAQGQAQSDPRIAGVLTDEQLDVLWAEYKGGVKFRGGRVLGALHDNS